MKYPIGIQTFDKIREGGYIYIDKTDLIYKLTHSGTIYFLSRPRRFGKSLLISTLKCYFEGKKELFKGLKIDSLETEWKQYPVFHIDFNGTDFTRGNALDETVNGYVKSWESIYGSNPYSQDLGDRFAFVIHTAHEKTGMPCVILIDEYDKPLRRNADEAIAQIDNMGYAREYANDRRTVYKIGCCFSSETGTVSDFNAVKQQ